MQEGWTSTNTLTKSISYFDHCSLCFAVYLSTTTIQPSGTSPWRYNHSSNQTSGDDDQISSSYATESSCMLCYDIYTQLLYIPVMQYMQYNHHHWYIHHVML